MRETYPIFDTAKKAQEYAEEHWAEELAKGEEVAIYYCGKNYIVGVVGKMDFLPSGWKIFVL